MLVAGQAIICSIFILKNKVRNHNIQLNFFIRVILLAYFVIGTQSSLAQSSIIDVVTHSDIVTDSDNIVGNGDVVVFTTKVTNISNITISSLTISNSLV
ncbi:MAG: hypothetical protein MUQ91_02130, partial [Flavobacteriaceae bacterium]|nr:hypothetical protein [Flavobacteriaceae bacterium]